MNRDLEILARSTARWHRRQISRFMAIGLGFCCLVWYLNPMIRDAVQSMTFRSQIPHEILYEVIDDVVEIKREKWFSFVSFRSDRPAHEISRDLDQRFTEWQDAIIEENRRRGAEEYYRTVEQDWADKPGIPWSITKPGKPTIETFAYIDDNGEWQIVNEEAEVT